MASQPDPTTEPPNPGMQGKGERHPSPPPGRPAYAQLRLPAAASASFNGICLRQVPPPTALATSCTATSEVPSLLLHPCPPHPTNTHHHQGGCVLPPACEATAPRRVPFMTLQLRHEPGSAYQTPWCRAGAPPQSLSLRCRLHFPMPRPTRAVQHDLLRYPGVAASEWLIWQRQGRSRREEGGGGSETQKLVYQKWPKSMFPFVNVIFPTMKSGYRGVRPN